MANRSVGSLTGTTLELGKKVCCLVLKNSTKEERTLAPGHSVDMLAVETTQREAVRVRRTRLKVPMLAVRRLRRINLNKSVCG